MKDEGNRSSKTTLIAAMAAGLFAGAAPLSATAADAPKVHCDGANDCKGKSACHTASTSCAGQNGCKGKGWVNLTAEECKTKGGTVPGDKKDEKKDEKKGGKKGTKGEKKS